MRSERETCCKKVKRTTPRHEGVSGGARTAAADVDANFDVCWSCELPRGELDEFECGALADRDTIGGRHDLDVPNAIEVESPADADAMRAWRAALFGLMFPPLLLYALYLTIKVMNRELSPRTTWRYYAALAISLVMISLWWTVLVRL